MEDKRQETTPRRVGEDGLNLDFYLVDRGDPSYYSKMKKSRSSERDFVIFKYLKPPPLDGSFSPNPEGLFLGHILQTGLLRP